MNLADRLAEKKAQETREANAAATPTGDSQQAETSAALYDEPIGPELLDGRFVGIVPITYKDGSEHLYGRDTDGKLMHVSKIAVAGWFEEHARIKPGSDVAQPESENGIPVLPPTAPRPLTSLEEVGPPTWLDEVRASTEAARLDSLEVGREDTRTSLEEDGRTPPPAVIVAQDRQSGTSIVAPGAPAQFIGVPARLADFLSPADPHSLEVLDAGNITDDEPDEPAQHNVFPLFAVQSIDQGPDLSVAPSSLPVVRAVPASEPPKLTDTRGNPVIFTDHRRPPVPLPDSPSAGRLDGAAPYLLPRFVRTRQLAGGILRGTGNGLSSMKGRVYLLASGAGRGEQRPVGSEESNRRSRIVAGIGVLAIVGVGLLAIKYDSSGSHLSTLKDLLPKGDKPTSSHGPSLLQEIADKVRHAQEQQQHQHHQGGSGHQGQQHGGGHQGGQGQHHGQGNGQHNGQGHHHLGKPEELTLNKNHTIWNDTGALAERHGVQLSPAEQHRFVGQILWQNDLSWEDARHLQAQHHYHIGQQLLQHYLEADEELKKVA